MVSHSNFPILSIEYELIWSLTKNPFNPRRHSPKQLDQLAKSIMAFGFNNVIVVDEARNVLRGNALLEVARRLGMTEVPTVIVRHLSPEQKRAFAIADNKIAENASWDLEILKSELQSSRASNSM